MPKLLLIAVCVIFLAGCEEQSPAADGSVVVASSADTVAGSRWYSDAQVVIGREVFAQHCAVCHGAQAEGAEGDWREKLSDGSFRPPPLDGSAHAWHHPQEILLRVIDYGGQAMGGKMPEFIDVLEQDEKLAAIAFFQDFWSDEIYQQWMQMGGTN